jgi:glycosyltransferase involved in cell wall biosynthesis
MDHKISIITISLNASKYIEQTILSIINQTWSNKEYIIIDGGSTDGTLDIIKKYESKIDRYVSEPDDGIADAMNKGVDFATGDYILFVHSDDYLLNSTILERASSFLNSEFDLYIFPVILKNKNTNKKSTARTLNFWTNFKMGSCHQGQLCSKKLFDRIGAFNINYNIVMDYDFILRAYRADVQSCSINIPLAVMRLTGISSRTDWKSLQERFQEEKRVHLNNCPTDWMRSLYAMYWALYLPYRWCRYWIIR